VKIATKLVQQPGGHCRRPFRSGANSKPLTVFSINPRLPSNRFSSRTGNAPGRPARAGEYLLIEDTSELDYTDHPATEEMGTIGDGGDEVCSCTPRWRTARGQGSARAAPGIVLGVGPAVLSRWGRPRARWKPGATDEPSAGVAALGSGVGGGGPPAGSTWIYLADREADFYEPIERGQRQGVHFIIRAFHDRVLQWRPRPSQSRGGSGPLCGQLDRRTARPCRASGAAGPVEVRTCSLYLNGPGD